MKWRNLICENSRLKQVDLTKRIAIKRCMKKSLKKYQWQLLHLQHVFVKKKSQRMIVMEGWDAAGKGGAIKRMTEHLIRGDLKYGPSLHLNHMKIGIIIYIDFGVKFPAMERLLFLIVLGMVVCLLKESKDLQMKTNGHRAYNEINEFERQLLNDANYLIIKFWLHISKDEQLKRFNKRLKDPLKSGS